jgi:hypothetical protein
MYNFYYFVNIYLCCNFVMSNKLYTENVILKN